MISLSARWGVGGGGGQIEEEIQFNFKESKAITETSDIHRRSVLKIHNHLEAGSASETLCILSCTMDNIQILAPNTRISTLMHNR
jgi:ABC-type Fe2+-enterobactin transport system substrate-binding protein